MSTIISRQVSCRVLHSYERNDIAERRCETVEQGTFAYGLASQSIGTKERERVRKGRQIERDIKRNESNIVVAYVESEGERRRIKRREKRERGLSMSFVVASVVVLLSSLLLLALSRFGSLPFSLSFSKRERGLLMSFSSWLVWWYF